MKTGEIQANPLKTFKAGQLQVKIFESRSLLGLAAAKDAAGKIRELLASGKKFVNIILAAAPSQNEFLFCLSMETEIDWNRVNAFHMDEYTGIDSSSPQSFGSYLRAHFFDIVKMHEVFYINGNTDLQDEECKRYAGLLKNNPPDIVCMGIGENTHIAFNDPHTADFNDPFFVKLVSLDDASRMQQVNDGCFETLTAVPVSAITLTVPALLQAGSIFCMVPGSTKSLAVYQTITNEIDAKFPSTSLKQHPGATLYLDNDSARKL